MKKRAQVTLFIILGVVVVASLGAVFMLTKNVEEVNTPQKLGPRGFIDKCTRDIVEESVEEIIASGGVLEPKLSIMFNGSNYTYLCYQGDYYRPCLILNPTLETGMEQLIYSKTVDRIQDECFNVLRQDFENRGYEVNGNETNYAVDILPGEIRLSLTKSMIVSSGGSSQNFENFNTKIISPVHEIIHTTNKILNYEAKYCYFDTINHMLLYPDEKVTLISYKDSKLYKIESRSKGIEFKFAVRGCANPPTFI